MATESSERLLDSLDNIPDELHSFFREEEGKFRFAGAVALEDHQRAKAKQAEILGEKKAERAAREKAERELGEFRARLNVDDEDIDPDQIADAWRLFKKSQGDPDAKHVDAVSRAEAAQERKKAVEEIAKKKDTEIAELRKENGALRDDLERNICEGGLLKFCDESKQFRLRDKGAKALLNTLRADRPFIVKDGKWAMREDKIVTDDDGIPIETPEAWIAFQVASMDLAAESHGAGAEPGSRNGKSFVRSKKFEEMSEADKIELAKDPAAHRKAVMEASERARSNRRSVAA